MDEVKHKCPKCGTIMRKLEPDSIETPKRRPQVYDLGKGFYGTSGVPGGSGESVSTNSTSSGTTVTTDPSYLPQRKTSVILLPYECTNPDCRHRMSFRR